LSITRSTTRKAPVTYRLTTGRYGETGNKSKESGTGFYSASNAINPPLCNHLPPLHQQFRCSRGGQRCHRSGLSAGSHSSLEFNNSSCLFCKATAIALAAIANLSIDFCPSMMVSVIDNEPNLAGLLRCRISSASAICSRVISLLKFGFWRSIEASAVNSNSNFGQSFRNLDFRFIPESITSPISHLSGSSVLAVTAGTGTESGGYRTLYYFRLDSDGNTNSSEHQAAMARSCARAWRSTACSLHLFSGRARRRTAPGGIATASYNDRDRCGIHLYTSCRPPLKSST
jgi:hypothetical protein